MRLPAIASPLSARAPLRSALCLRPCYAISGTAITYAGQTALRRRCEPLAAEALLVKEQRTRLHLSEEKSQTGGARPGAALREGTGGTGSQGAIEQELRELDSELKVTCRVRNCHSLYAAMPCPVLP